jgi:hypothetical protein
LGLPGREGGGTLDGRPTSSWPETGRSEGGPDFELGESQRVVGEERARECLTRRRAARVAHGSCARLSPDSAGKYGKG